MSMMKFYFTPGSCSTGIHILLEEIGLVFEAYPVNLPNGDNLRSEFLAINPRGTVPVLVLPDGRALTDFVSIAWWLARSYPRCKLLPESLEGEVEALERLNYVVHTIHGQGYTRIFTPEKYVASTAEVSRVQVEGRRIVERGLAAVDAGLHAQQRAKDGFTIADAALFYIEFWAAKSEIVLPEHCRAHYQRMLRRPAVRQVLSEEGYHATVRKSLEEGAHATA